MHDEVLQLCFVSGLRLGPRAQASPEPNISKIIRMEPASLLWLMLTSCSRHAEHADFGKHRRECHGLSMPDKDCLAPIALLVACYLLICLITCSRALNSSLYRMGCCYRHHFPNNSSSSLASNNLSLYLVAWQAVGQRCR